MHIKICTSDTPKLSREPPTTFSISNQDNISPYTGYICTFTKTNPYGHMEVSAYLN
jgi:hypothetical protein